MSFPLLLMFGALGLLVGSFLNVCIYRLPRYQSVVTPRSHCPACGKVLDWNENIPVVSWVVLGGRCRTCDGRISMTYPLVEIATAIVFAWVAGIYGLTPLLFVRLLFASAMIVLFMVDLEHHLLPNAVTLPGIVVGFIASLFLPPGWISSLLGILLGGGVLLGIGELYYRTRGLEGLGMGDVKMLAMIGGFLGWPLMLVTLVLSSIAGSLVGVALLVTRRGGMHAELPFGTFLALAALIAAGVGDAVVEWYLSYY